VRHERETSALHKNRSFIYGMSVMLNQVYADGRGSPDAACRKALATPVDPPSGFDFGKAVAGCKYQEYLLDN
jgi:hypothetical protein